MKKQILILLIYLLPILSFSQLYKGKVIDFQHSDFYKTLSRNYGYLSSCENQIIFVKTEKDDIVIRIFDPSTLDIKEIKKHSIKGGNSSHFFIEDVISLKDRAFLFFSQWDKKKEVEQLFYNEIDPKTGNYIGDARKIINVNRKVSSDMGYDKFQFAYSADSSKLMIYYRIHPEKNNDKKSTDIYGIYVFDSEINEQWHSETKMPYTESKVDNNDYQVSNDGRVLFLTTVFTNNTSEIEKVRNKINYRLELLEIKDGTSGIIKHPIKLENKLLKSVDFKELPNGDLVIGGIYSNTKSEFKNLDFDDIVYNKLPKNSDGVYGIHLDKDGNIIANGYHEFPLSFLNSYEKKSSKKKNNRKGAEKAKVKFHDNRKTIISNDGSIMCIGEQDYYKITDTDRHVNNVNYFYDDISVCKINPDMELDWIKKLPKRQVAINSNETPHHISYVDFKDDEYLYFLYKDNIDNIDLKKNEYPKKCNINTKGVLALYKVNIEDGSVTKTVVIKAEKSNKKFIMELISGQLLELSPTEFVFENHLKGKEHELAKISILKK